jgi:hypothetical protein
MTIHRPYTGGCACGAVRYATPHAPMFQNHCQCRDCQRRSGTGHGSWLTFPAQAHMATSGCPPNRLWLREMKKELP